MTAAEATFGGARHTFLAIEAPDPAAAVAALAGEVGRGSVAWLRCCAPDAAALETVHGLARDMPGGHRPAVETVQMAPLRWGCTLTAWLVDGPGGRAEPVGECMARVVGPELDLLFAGLTSSADRAGADYADVCGEAFAAMSRRLDTGGWRFEDLVQMMSYLRPEDAAGEGFAAFGRARDRFFATLAFGEADTARFPANTGIGATYAGFALSGIACRSPRTLRLENPMQTPPPLYDRPALFSRAIALVSAREVLVFVAGTGSVVGATVAHRGDVRAQATQVATLVDALLGRDNLARHGVRVRAGGLARLRLASVYLRDPAAYDDVREALGRRLPEPLALQYLRSSLSRQALAIELDGIAVMERS